MTNVKKAMLYQEKWRCFSEPLFFEKSSTTVFSMLAEGHNKVGWNHSDASVDNSQEERFNMEEKQHCSHVQ